MATTVEEFVNPKSMTTPGAMAALVATVAGGFFSMFGLRWLCSEASAQLATVARVGTLRDPDR
jgi:hypothetical protein